MRLAVLVLVVAGLGCSTLLDVERAREVFRGTEEPTVPILVDSPAPEFARAGEALLRKGEIGGFYRSNGNVKGGNIAATVAGEMLSLSYQGSTTEADN